MKKFYFSSKNTNRNVKNVENEQWERVNVCVCHTQTHRKTPQNTIRTVMFGKNTIEEKGQS